MRCKFCKREVYIAHICPYCKEYFCIEHRNPKTHNCAAYQQLIPTIIRPKTALEEKLEKIQAPPTTLKKIQKTLFTSAFTLVIIEEVLRLVSYLKYSPYLEPNIYITLLAQWVTPYISSPIFFLIICAILFAAKKLSEKEPKNELKSLLTKAVPLSVYVTTILMYIYYIANWIFIISP
ncbi:MAG: zinc finger AN1 domain-containing stress-associated protein [Conexivisphaerales archaeon]